MLKMRTAVFFLLFWILYVICEKFKVFVCAFTPGHWYQCEEEGDKDSERHLFGAAQLQ